MSQRAVRVMWRWIDDALGDARYAVRQFRRHPGFTVVAVTMLALGIGVNSAVYTVTAAVLFRGFPGVDPENRLLYISSRGNTSYPDFEDWRAQSKSFDGMAVVANGGLRYRLSDQPGSSEMYDATRLSANAFRVLGQAPILGRDFATADESPGAAPVTLLSYTLWDRRYGKSPSVIGQTVRVNDRPTTIIGVMPAGFDFPHHRVDLWVPLEPVPAFAQRQARVLWFAFGRMAPGVTIAGARAEMDTIGRRLASAYPLTNRDIRPDVRNFHEFFFGTDSAAYYGSMLGAVGFVLLITCANLANLLLAGAAGRSGEISVRLALGAGRWRIVRQLLVESLMMSAVGGIFGWLIAMWSVRMYELVASPPSAYDQWQYAMDARVFAYLAAISACTGLLFGIAPARRLSRLDVNATLKNGVSGASGGRAGKRLSAALVIGQMALAVVLLAGAGVMVRSFLNIYTADIGVHTANIITASVGLPAANYPTGDAQIAFFDHLTRQLEAIPGVESVALTTAVPTYSGTTRPFELDGAPALDDQRRPTASTLVVSPGYFRTMGATLLAGREFDVADGASSPAVVIVNQRFAGTTWPGQDALGKRLRLFDARTTVGQALAGVPEPGRTAPDAWTTVVGVVSNIVQNQAVGGGVDTLRRAFDPLVYVPFRQKPGGFMSVVARTRLPPRNLVSSFRRQLQTVDSGLFIGSGFGPGTGPTPLAESLAFQYWSKGLNGGLFLIFATLALGLASVGLSAVVAHTVSLRTQEIGIRTALGASAGDILALIFGQGMLPVGIGLCIGLPAALAVTPLLKSQLVNVSPTDPVTLIVASGVLLLSATLGCWMPARRAMRVDPAVALRHE
jgi:putative ABC transport system permease protein